MIIALIIFALQLNWIVVSIDFGRFSGDLISELVSRDDLLEDLRDAGIIDDRGVRNPPELTEMLDEFTRVVRDEINEFTEQVQNIDILAYMENPALFNPANLVRNPPNVSRMVNAFTNIMIWEAVRVTENMGEFNQSISVSDLPNLLSLPTLATDVILNQGEGWGMTPEDLRAIDTAPLQTAEQVINIVRIVFAACTLLLILVMYLIVAGARPAGIIGQISMVIMFILSGAFALGMFFANRMVAENLGDYVRISAGWYVYVVIGLSVLGFVLTTVHKRHVKG